jgi:FkbM family methyltransferase
LKRLLGSLPDRWQQSMKRGHFARQVRRGAFRSYEPEYLLLGKVLSPGDWVLDVGANVGHYALKMSELVKSQGRVIALEPIPLTFELLAANCALSYFQNFTLLNVAASNRTGIVKMEVPKWKRSKMANFYEARIVPDSEAVDGLAILALKIDSLDIPQRVALVKIDAEGHELAVVEGMAALLERDHPIVVAEGTRANGFLESLGYTAQHDPRSPNYVWRFHRK